MLHPTPRPSGEVAISAWSLRDVSDSPANTSEESEQVGDHTSKTPKRNDGLYGSDPKKIPLNHVKPFNPTNFARF